MRARNPVLQKPASYRAAWRAPHSLIGDLSQRLPPSVPSGHPRSPAPPAPPLKIGDVTLGHKQCVINAHGGTSLPSLHCQAASTVSTQARVEPAKETARQDAPALALWKTHQNFGGLDPRFRRCYALLGPAPFCRGAPKAVSFQPIRTHSRPCEPSSNPLSVLSRLVRPNLSPRGGPSVPRHLVRTPLSLAISFLSYRAPLLRSSRVNIELHLCFDSVRKNKPRWLDTSHNISSYAHQLPQSIRLIYHPKEFGKRKS
jgi:hypothetical protein